MIPDPRQLALPCTLPPVPAGPIVECRQIGTRVRVLPVSEGFEPWFVSFPRALRVEGARYAVQTLRPMPRHYYHAGKPFVRVEERE